MKLNLFSAPFAHPLQRAPLQLFGLLWLIALAFALLDGGDGASDTGALALLASVCMLLHSGVQTDALRNAASALHRTRAPLAAWSGHARACLLNISLGWLLLAAAMALRCSLPSATAMQWTSAGALLSVMACLGTVIPLRRPGLLPRAWSWLGYAAIAALLAIIVAQVRFDTKTLLAWLDAQPATIRLSLMLTWPAAAGWLHLQWRKQAVSASAEMSGSSAAARGLYLRALRQLQRYSLLNEGILQSDGSTKPLGAGQRCVFMLLAPMQALLLMRASWGAQLDLKHFTGVIIVGAITSAGLLMRDLHWRHGIDAPVGPAPRAAAHPVGAPAARGSLPQAMDVQPDRP